MDRAPRPLVEVAEVATELATLRRELDQLGNRVSRLEAVAETRVAAAPLVASGGAAPAAVGRGEPQQSATADAVAATGIERAASPIDGWGDGAGQDAGRGPLVLTGRLLLVLAGGFLLRAVTEGGQLAAAIGVSLGLAYGLAWLAPALRAHRRGDETGAGFHAAATLLIAYPLLWEATMRFAVLGPRTGAVALAGVTAALLATAWVQRLPALAWLVTAATFAVATALGIGSREQAPFAAVLVALAGANLVLGLRRGWLPLAGFSAVAANLAVAGITVGALAPGRPLPAGAALLVQISLLLLYLGAAAWLARHGELTWEMTLQGATAVALGWGGALVVVRATTFGPALGLLGLALAIGAEGLALRALPAARRGRGLLLGAAAALIMGACALLLPAPALAWALIGLAACTAGALLERPALELQGALLVMAAAIGTGALADASRGLLAQPQDVGDWRLRPLLGAAAMGACLLVVAGRRREGRRHALATALLLATTAWLLAGNLAAAAAPWVAPDAGIFAAIGSGLLAGLAALLGRCGRGSRLAVAAWLVYPLLAALALKVLLVDLPRGRPFTLFFSFTALGAGLLAAAATRRAPAATSGDAARSAGVVV